MNFRSIGTTKLQSGREINVDYTMAAAEAFKKSLTPQLAEGKKFRFVYVSGAMTSQDQEKPLWFMQEFRRIRVRIWL
jgi:hypothetical protein